MHVVLLPLLTSACDAAGGPGILVGTPADSVEMYRELAAARPGDPLPLYDLGTVLLVRQRYEEARPPLLLAVGAEAADLRQRAHYNLGNTRLEPACVAAAEEGAAARSARVDELREAAESYREALRITPGDVDAKWNLELANRRLHEERTPPPDPPEPPQPE